MDIIQNTPEWLEWRRSKIGASDCPKIMGVCPYTTPRQLWLLKKALVASETNSYMQRGHDLEEAARQAYTAFSGISVFPQVVQHDEVEYMVASLDGISFDRKVILEIKCPGKKAHQEAMDGNVPRHYYYQMQHQLIVSKAEVAHYWSFDGQEGVMLEVKPDLELWPKILEEEALFYKLMQGDAPPEPTAKEAFDDQKDKQILETEDPSWIELAKMYFAKKAELDADKAAIKAKEKDCDMLQKQLIALSNGASCCGGGYAFVKMVKRGTVDYAAVPQLKGLDLEAYRRPPIESWKISSV